MRLCCCSIIIADIAVADTNFRAARVGKSKLTRRFSYVIV